MRKNSRKKYYAFTKAQIRKDKFHKVASPPSKFRRVYNRRFRLQCKQFLKNNEIVTLESKQFPKFVKNVDWNWD